MNESVLRGEENEGLSVQLVDEELNIKQMGT